MEHAKCATRAHSALEVVTPAAVTVSLAVTMADQKVWIWKNRPKAVSCLPLLVLTCTRYPLLRIPRQCPGPSHPIPGPAGAPRLGLTFQALSQAPSGGD